MLCYEKIHHSYKKKRVLHQDTFKIAFDTIPLIFAHALCRKHFAPLYFSPKLAPFSFREDQVRGN